MSKYVVDFYQHLFRSTNPNKANMSEYITSAETHTIDSNLADELDSELTINELDAVYSKLKNNKSPGWDGLTAEFFKIIWEYIRLILCRHLRE